MISFCDKHGGYEGDRCPKCEPEGKFKQSRATVVGGLDLAKLHDYSAMVDAEISFHKAKVKGVKTWPHVDYTVVIEDVGRRYERTGMTTLAFDEGGVGEPIKELLYARGIRAEGIKFGEYVDYTNPWGDREHAPVKYAMVEYGRAVMQAGYVQLPGKGAEELVQQLGEQEIVQSASDRPRYAHPEGRHDDLAWAFLMMLYVARPWLTGNGIFAVMASGTSPTQNYYGAWQGGRH